MNTYDVYFRSDLQWGNRELIAETPEKALELACQIARDEPHSLDLDYYPGCDSPINEIEVCDQEDDCLAVWYDDDLRLRLAAQSLLIAAEHVLDRWQNGDIEEVIHEVALAVALAKGRAA